MGKHRRLLFLLVVAFTMMFVVGCSEVSILEEDTKEDVVEQIEEKEEELIVEKEDDVVEKEEVKTEKVKTEKVKVDFVRIVDGDTIKVIYKGEELSVRILLIDTPETKHPSKGVEPFGKEASEYAEKVFKNASEVALEFEGKERDHYGRLLAYVWVDGDLYNNMIVEEGLARVGYIYGNKLYLEELMLSQEKASFLKKNIWEIDGYVNKKGEGFNVDVYGDSIVSDKLESDKTVVNLNSGEDNSGECDIKGNINSKGEKIYHTSSGSFYDRTIAEEMFCSESEAVAAGYRASLR